MHLDEINLQLLALIQSNDSNFQQSPWRSKLAVQKRLAGDEFKSLEQAGFN